MRKRSVLLWAGSALTLVGAAVLAVHCYSSLHSASAQKAAKEWLDTAEAAHSTASTRSPCPAVKLPRRGEVLGELNIARLRVSVMVFEGDDSGILKIGAGHIAGTALPAGKGNIAIAAHRDTYFRPLHLIHPNDVITLRTPSGTLRFAVTGTEVVQPSRVDVLASAPGRDLTLVTCYPFSYIGRAPHRFIVYAKKMG